MEYSYQAKSTDGKILSGRVEASSEEEAVSVLHQRGLVVLSLEASKVFAKDVGTFFHRVKEKDLAEFTRQLATLVDADVPFVDSLNTLARQAANPALQKVLVQLAAEVEAGSFFSKALSIHQDIFSEYCRMSEECQQRFALCLSRQRM